MSVYQLVTPREHRVPIVLSVPHCGVEVPVELAGQYKPQLIKAPEDTDWFVQQLYDFAPEMGITMIHATYSRWVIDLNRHPQSKPLYTDGRIITALCPATTFKGEKLYIDERAEVEANEVKRRIALYYEPYHRKLELMLEEMKEQFGKVLLWDCHSIRQVVPTIQNFKFPDLILGDVDGTSASPVLSAKVMEFLGRTKYSVSHNNPFKGGYITRHFGRPEENQHAMQLEMTKVNYMDDDEVNYNKTRANTMSSLLRTIFSELIQKLN